MTVDPALLKSRQDAAAARGPSPIMQNGRGGSDSVIATLAQAVNANPFKKVLFGNSDIATRLGLTAEATSAAQNTNGSVNGVALNAEQPKTTIEPISTVVAENSKKIDEAIDPDATMLTQSIITKPEISPTKSKPSGPENTLGVEIT